jgi:threonine dehydratase
MSETALPTLKDIEEAEGRIRKYIPPTPLEHSRRLSQECGRDVYLKLESFNLIRVFKLRGALNKLLSLGDSALKRGVVTASSGNHGLAISYSARLFGAKAVICVPENANPQKVAAIEENGAEVIRGGANYDEAYANAVKTADKRNLTLVHAFNDRDVIAGQGTCGLEIARQNPSIDSAIVGIGGGGLISGVSIALKALVKGVLVYGVQSRAIPSMYESVREGKRVRVVPQSTIADGLQSSTPGELTFEAVSQFVDKVVLVSDEQIEDAIYDLITKARVIAEPAGASPLAALKGPLRGEPGERTVLVISGGNISVELLGSILSRKVVATP